MFSSKNNRKHSLKCTKSKCVCLNEVIEKKLRLKMKNKSYRWNINRPRPRDGHKNTKYKWYLSMY